MHRKFISFVVSAAVVVTSLSATTAQAGGNGYRYGQGPIIVQPQRSPNQGNEAVAAALAGIAALFIIGKTIERHNDNARPKAHHAPRAHRSDRGHHRAHRGGHRHHKHRGHGRGHRHGGHYHRH